MVKAVALGLWLYLEALADDLYDLAVALGGPGLFFIAVGDSSFLSLPEGNDILIVVLSTGQTWGVMTYYVTMTILGSVCGCVLLFSVGRRGGIFMQKKVKQSRLHDLRRLYNKWGLWAIMIPSILPPPTPFKICVLSAGLFGVPFWRFVLAVTLGRSIRYFMWGILAVLYGRLAKHFLENNLPFISLLLFLLLAGAIVGYVLIWARMKRRTPQQETV